MPDPNMKILVVDDSSTTRQIVKKMLNQLGFKNTEEAGNGAQAHAKLKAERYGFVVTDWNMPYMDGLELLKTVRKDPLLMSLPVLMVTGEAEKEKAIQAVQAGVSNYIVKPFTVEVFKEKLERIFGKGFHKSA